MGKAKGTSVCADVQLPAKVRVALYERVSTEEQAIRGLSIEAQREVLEHWAADEHMHIVGHYTDAGISARKPASKRPELQRLLADIRAGKVDLVAFTKLDRWFRSVSEYYKVQDILDAHRVAWRAVLEDYETVTSSGVFKVNIMLSVNQNEADRTSERIKIVFDSKKARREVVSGSTPLGFKIENKHLVPDENAHIIKDLFATYISMQSAYGAQRHLKDEYGIVYDITTVKELLRNKRYIGEAYGMTDFCEPIIDRNTFDRAQELLQKRAQRNSGGKGRVYIFRGLLKCEACGHAMVGLVGRGHYYYRCGHHVNVGDCAYAPHIREDRIEEFLLDDILKKIEYRNAAIKVKEIGAVDTAPIKRKLERLKDLYLNDLIQLDQYKQEYSLLTQQLKDAETSNEHRVPIDIEPIKMALASYHALPREGKREFWAGLIKEIYVPSLIYTLRDI